MSDDRKDRRNKKPRKRRRGRTPLDERLFRRLLPSVDKRTRRTILRHLRRSVVALVTVVLSLFHDRGVGADELILRASRAERATPVAARVVQLTIARQDTGKSVRIVRQTGGTPSAASPALAPGDVPSLFRPALIAIGFDWQRPLTIDTVAQYRLAHPPDTSERVESTANGHAFVLTATAPTGAVSAMQVSVDAENYQVVRAHFTVPGVGTVDIEDLSHSAAYFPRRAGLPVISLSRDELDRAELRVRQALADTGADLEQRVQISRTPEGVRVQSGAGGAARWEDSRLEAQLRALTHVRVDLFTVDLSTGGTGTHVVPTDRLPTTCGLERWRKRRFGPSAEGASVLPKLMESVVTVRSRLTVVAELAKRYPHPKRDLSNEARGLLGQLVESQYRRLREELSGVRDGVFGLWGPVMLHQEAKTAPATLVAQASVALSRARAMETLVRTSVAQNDLTQDEEERLRNALKALWGSVHGESPRRRDGDWCVQDIDGGRATCGVPRH